MPQRENVWLIERGQPEREVPTVWWNGEDWTTSAHDAVKYVTKDAAEAEIARSQYGRRCLRARATEHGFDLRAT